MLRGVRGATTVESDDAAHIADRTSELVRILVESNGIGAGDVASAVFTATEDLSAAFPAVAARTVPGWEAVPLLCAREIPVPGALGRCIRVLIHWNTDRPATEIRHAFVRGARTLRPEWAIPLPGDEEGGR
ncbi:MAG TPA: chorismate mutase [Thermoanaerobaculia bacterium]